MAASLFVACGSSGGGEAVDPGGDAGADANEVDAGVVDAAPTTVRVNITTTRPNGAVVDATWGAYRDAAGTWKPIQRSALGTYHFDASGPRWQAAFACDNGRASVVSVHQRAITNVAPTIELDEECRAAGAAASWTLSGTMAAVPATTGWLDFGYPLESRGSALPLQGANADYEEVNVDEGTWDLAFGLRDDPAKALTRVLLKRGYTNTADATVNLDMATSVTPIPKKIDVTGFVGGEDITLSMLHTTGGGATGLAVGPQNPSIVASALNDMWDSLPAASLVATDRYRLSLAATSATTLRTVEGSFHDAADVAVALPTPIDAPVAQKNGTKITAKLPAYAGAALYEAIALVQLSRDARRVFRITVEPDAIGDTLDVVPDLSSVTGYSAEWNLPTDEDVLVSARAHETPAALADGMRTRTAARGIVLTP